jgi:hypothetical protein
MAASAALEYTSTSPVVPPPPPPDDESPLLPSPPPPATPPSRSQASRGWSAAGECTSEKALASLCELIALLVAAEVLDTPRDLAASDVAARPQYGNVALPLATARATAPTCPADIFPIPAKPTTILIVQARGSGDGKIQENQRNMDGFHPLVAGKI